MGEDAEMKTHGMTNTRLFHIWSTMKQRCCNPNKQHYECYGGRGIEVCDEWLKDFNSFYEWSLKNGYTEELTLDRINIDGNYEPSNCRWVDRVTQANNKKNNRVVEYKGKQYTVAELSSKYNINYSCLYSRIRQGWNIERALMLQPKRGRNQYEKI